MNNKQFFSTSAILNNINSFSETNENNFIFKNSHLDHHTSWDELNDLVLHYKTNSNPNFILGTHILGSFSRSFPINDIPHVIPSIQFLQKPIIEWDISNVSNRLSVLGFSEINIWSIIPNEIFQNKEAQYFEVGSPEGFPCQINFIIISVDLLFSSNLFNMTFFTKNNPQVLNNYLHFNGFYWSEVVSAFRNHGVIISGGTNTKRHILTPNQLRLAQLLSCQEGAKLGENVKSFYLKDKPSIIALTPKDKTERKSILKRDTLTVHEYDIEPFRFNSKHYQKNTVILEIDKNRFNLDQTRDQATSLELLIRTQAQERQRLQNFTKFGVKKSNEELKALFNELKINPDFSENIGETEIALNPNHVRLPIMTKTYNVTNNGITKQLESQFECINHEGKTEGKTQSYENNENNQINNDDNSKTKPLIKGLVQNKREFHTCSKSFNLEKYEVFSKSGNKIEGFIPNKLPVLNEKTVNEIIKHKNVYTYLDQIHKWISEINLRFPNDCVEKEKAFFDLQKKIELDWVSNIKSKLLDPDAPKYILSGFIHKTFESWTAFMENNREHKKILKHFPSEDLITEIKKIESLIIGFTMIITHYKSKSYTNVAYSIGYQCLFNIFINKKEQNNNFLLYLEKNNIQRDSLIHLGNWILEMFISKEMIEQKYDHDELDTSYIVINNNALQDIIKNINPLPASLPMLSKPLEWSEKKKGGFLSNTTSSVITGSDKNHAHKIENLQNLFNAVNSLNTIPFKINTLLLDYLTGEGDFLLKNELSKVSYDKSKYISLQLQQDITIKIADAYRGWNFFLTTHADWRGRLYTNSFWISYQGNDLANALTNFQEGEVLNEIGKDYLYIYGANAYNENNIAKKPYQERIAWVKNNLEKIIKMDRKFILKADLPFVFASFCLIIKEIIQNPDYKVCLPVFLDATCSGIQHLAALIQDYELGSRLNLVAQLENDPVGDIYGGLVDPINARINSYSDKKAQDDQIVQFDQNENYIIPESWWEVLKFVKLNRSNLKGPIMTKTYNVTNYGMAKQLESQFECIKQQIVGKNGKTFENTYYKVPSIEGGFVNLTKKHLFVIAQIINEEVFIAFPPLQKIYDYFINIAKILTKFDIQISWSTPAGLNHTQNYIKSIEHKVRIPLGEKSKTLVLRKILEGKTDKEKQRSAIIPNIIHSLDAAHLINIINQAKSDGFEPVISVHDCFGTHPNKMFELSQRVKKEFILLYSKEQFLRNFQEKVINEIKNKGLIIGEIRENDVDRKVIKIGSIKKEYELQKGISANVILFSDENRKTNKIKKLIIPDPPQMGKLNLESIIDSQYMIT